MGGHHLVISAGLGCRPKVHPTSNASNLSNSDHDTKVCLNKVGVWMRHAYPRHTSLLSLARTQQLQNLAQQLRGEFLESKYGILLSDYVGVPLSGWCSAGIEHWPFRDPNQWDVVPLLRPTLYLGAILRASPTSKNSNQKELLGFIKYGPNALYHGWPEHSIIPTWHPMWQKIGAKSLG